MDQRHGNYLISDAPTRLDATAIHAYLTRSYWSEGIPLQTVERALSNSMCIGVYANDGAQVGLVRIITDYATFAYLCDVYVLEQHRGQGLARAMLAVTMEHPKLQGLRSWSLGTRDAHKLYEKFGFKVTDNPGGYMNLRFPNVYRQTPESK